MSGRDLTFTRGLGDKVGISNIGKKSRGYNDVSRETKLRNYVSTNLEIFFEISIEIIEETKYM